MAQSLSDINGILSLENSGQVGMWKNIWYIISTVKQHRDNIKLCYDPVNVLSSEPIFTKDLHKLTPYAPTAQGLKFIPWTSDDIAIFHIKQKKNLKVLDVVNEGDVDWDLQLDMLKEINYRGPICFEMAPSEAIFDNIKSSLDYLNQLSVDTPAKL